MIEDEKLNELSAANPGKPTIVLKSKCADCACQVSITITITSGGFGLMGGVLFGVTPDGYTAKCLDCYQVNPKLSNIK